MKTICSHKYYILLFVAVIFSASCYDNIPSGSVKSPPQEVQGVWLFQGGKNDETMHLKICADGNAYGLTWDESSYSTTEYVTYWNSIKGKILMCIKSVKPSKSGEQNGYHICTLDFLGRDMNLRLLSLRGTPTDSSPEKLYDAIDKVLSVEPKADDVYIRLVKIHTDELPQPPLGLNNSASQAAQQDRNLIVAAREPMHEAPGNSEVIFSSEDKYLIREVAKAVREPLDGQVRFSTVENDLLKEYAYLSELSLAISNIPSGHPLAALNQLNVPISNCASILDRISEIEGTRPSNSEVNKRMSRALVKSGIAAINTERGNLVGALAQLPDVFKDLKFAIEADLIPYDIKILKLKYKENRAYLDDVACQFIRWAYERTTASSKEFGTVGIGLDQKRPSRISEVYEPAASSGVAVGDIIEQINHKSIPRKFTVEQLVSIIRGHVGESITLSLRSPSNKLREVNILRSAIPRDVNIFTHGFVTSLNGSYTTDELILRNGIGKDLHNCSIIINLSGKSGISRHIHFLDKWQAGEVVKASYHFANEHYRHNRTKEDTELINVLVHSDEVFKEDSIVYSDAHRASSIDALFDKVSFRVDRIYFKEGLFSDDHAGLSIALDGIPIRPSQCVITCGRGDNKVTQVWDLEYWKPGTSLLFRNREFNRIINDHVEFYFRFPHTDYHKIFFLNSINY